MKGRLLFSVEVCGYLYLDGNILISPPSAAQFGYALAPQTEGGARLGAGGEAVLYLPTIDGNVEYDMPAGTQPGTVFRLRGKGIPSVSGRGRGDQFVTIRVSVPTSLTGEQREALLAYAKAMGEDAPEPKGFFDKHRKKR